MPLDAFLLTRQAVNDLQREMEIQRKEMSNLRNLYAMRSTRRHEAVYMPGRNEYGYFISSTFSRAADTTDTKVTLSEVLKNKTRLQESSKIYVERKGKWFVSVTTSFQGSDASIALTKLFMRMTVNGADWPDTEESRAHSREGAEAAIALSTMLDLDAEDYMEVTLTSDDTGTPGVECDVNNVNVTLFRVGN